MGGVDIGGARLVTVQGLVQGVDVSSVSVCRCSTSMTLDQSFAVQSSHWRLRLNSIDRKMF